MGAGGSLSNNLKAEEPPPLPPPFYTGNTRSGISRISRSSCESSEDRRASRTSTVTLGPPGFQDPRSSGSLKNEEWWHQRSSAPSSSSLRPQQETLLTYAAQMTGWQSGCGSTAPSMHQEAMELARTVSHLAAANQQLASAHTTLLAQLEALYLELNKERELRIDSNRDTVKKQRRSSGDYEEENIKLARRVANLEAAISERKSIFGAQDSSWHERENLQLRASLEELENRFTSGKDVAVQSYDDDEEMEARLGTSIDFIDSKVANQPFGRCWKNSKNFEVEKNLKRTNEKRRRSPRLEENNKEIEEEIGTALSNEYQKAVERIQVLEVELQNSCGQNIIGKLEEKCEADSKDRLANEELCLVEEDDTIDLISRGESKNFRNEEEIRILVGQIERLKQERIEFQEINRKLVDDLEEQKNLVEKMRRDYEISRSQYEKVESSLIEGKEQFDSLMKDFDVAKLETSRLLKELQSFHKEKDTASARIAVLEDDLAKSTLANKQVVEIENQENSRLRKKLSEEIASKMEQGKALEDALKEIQRLNGIIGAGEKSDKTEETEEIPDNVSNTEEETLDQEISVPRSSNMEEFRKELSLKREARQRAIAAVSSEMDRLRRELDAEKEAHSETSRVLDLLKSAQTNSSIVVKQEVISKDVLVDAAVNVTKDDWSTKSIAEQNSNEVDAQILTDILKVSDELRSSIRLQTEKIDDLRYHLECEPEGHKNRIITLKHIADTSREVSSVRERQINKLKNVLSQILARLGDERFRVEITDDVRAEHDRQLEDIRRLRNLYDERLRLLVDLKESAIKELTDVKEKLKGSKKENGGLEEDLKKAEEKIDNQDTEISNLESQLGLTKADCRDLQNQMSVINGLFTQMLLSASSADMDLDRLTRLLQENHDLISDMAREEGTEAAALPKLLLDLVEQVEGRGGSKSADGEAEKKEEGPQEENIAHNLPKVWRVLLELLSCHAVDSPPVTPASLSTDPNSCYKSVDTPSGPRLVISVSKTYIRLKELILEKKHLEKEMNRMKQLNTHLESKLGEQEKRLSTVSSELSKTWNVVGRMQAQHQQLHTHEKILRYELQQKRKMLQELKQELEYCREKWESARQKNTNTEIEWRSLRREFAARKSLAAQDSFNNSGESGFSDERGDDSDEEDDAVEERIRIGPRRRARKENPRAPTPDTESEQPTDTELSESKTGSTATPEQRTPTPDTAIPNEDVSTAISIEDPTDNSMKTDQEHRQRPKPVNPLDQALANVIQNLITVDDNTANESAVSVDQSILTKTEESSISVNKEPNDVNQINESEEAEENTSLREPQVGMIPSEVSVFSIGPFPSCLAPPPVKSVQFSDPLVVGPSALPQADSVVGNVVPETEDSEESVKVDEIEKITIAETDLHVTEEIEENSMKSVSNSLQNSEEVLETREDSKESCCPSESNKLPSTSTTDNSTAMTTKPVRTHEEVLAARADRLKRLEEQADWLMKKMSATSRRGSALSTRLEELHEVYGEAPVPPPMPDVLPSVRIPSYTENQQARMERNVEKGPNETPPPDSP